MPPELSYAKRLCAAKIVGDALKEILAIVELRNILVVIRVRFASVCISHHRVQRAII